MRPFAADTALPREELVERTLPRVWWPLPARSVGCLSDGLVDLEPRVEGRVDIHHSAEVEVVGKLVDQDTFLVIGVDWIMVSFLFSTRNIIASVAPANFRAIQLRVCHLKKQSTGKSSGRWFSTPASQVRGMVQKRGQSPSETKPESGKSSVIAGGLSPFLNHAPICRRNGMKLQARNPKSQTNLNYEEPKSKTPAHTPAQGV